MVTRSSQESSVTEGRLRVVTAIDGLRKLQRSAGLNRLQKAALDHLEGTYGRSLRIAGSVIAPQQVASALRVAQRSLEAACVR